MGELGLDGTVRSVRGVLAAALRARAAGLGGVIVPEACAGEAVVVEGIAVHPVAQSRSPHYRMPVRARYAGRPWTWPR